MGETEAIAQMAEKIADEIFSEFFWDKLGPVNQNWACVKNDRHDRKTHPADVVFTYAEPYRNENTYALFDLKSYSKGAISKPKMRAAIESLATAVECAQVSSDFQTLYQLRGQNTNIIGVLFVYNHDGEYDADFHNNIPNIGLEAFQFPKDSRIIVMGPKDISDLYTITADMVSLRGKAKPALPPREHCTFYYPDLDGKALMQRGKAAASIECIMGPWIGIAHSKEQHSGLLLYYKRPGKSRDEFLYLLDYLLHFQQLKDGFEIEIRLTNPDKNAEANFQHAVQEYIRQINCSADLRLQLSAIKCSRVPSFRREFSKTAIGMEYNVL